MAPMPTPSAHLCRLQVRSVHVEHALDLFVEGGQLWLKRLADGDALGHELLRIRRVGLAQVPKLAHHEVPCEGVHAIVE
eukprot:11783669-Alexandrium_andersonii.AAC.1